MPAYPVLRRLPFIKAALLVVVLFVAVAAVKGWDDVRANRSFYLGVPILTYWCILHFALARALIARHWGLLLPLWFAYGDLRSAYSKRDEADLQTYALRPVSNRHVPLWLAVFLLGMFLGIGTGSALLRILGIGQAVGGD